MKKAIKRRKVRQAKKERTYFEEMVREIYDQAAAKAIVAIYHKRESAIREICEKMAKISPQPTKIQKVIMYGQKKLRWIYQSWIGGRLHRRPNRFLRRMALQRNSSYSNSEESDISGDTNK